jgi:hypothetical protein
MRKAWIRPSVLAVLALVTTIAWSVLIWTALQVSSVVLNTLDMIVELAAMTP